MMGIDDHTTTAVYAIVSTGSNIFQLGLIHMIHPVIITTMLWIKSINTCKYAACKFKLLVAGEGFSEDAEVLEDETIDGEDSFGTGLVGLRFRIVENALI